MKRSNKRHYVIAHHAIKLAERGHNFEAGVMCASHGVPFDVALRVITQPKKRRNINSKDYEENNGQ